MFTQLLPVTVAARPRWPMEQISEAFLEDLLLFLAGSLVGALLMHG
jgi:hypothetical protein